MAQNCGQKFQRKTRNINFWADSTFIVFCTNLFKAKSCLQVFWLKLKIRPKGL